MRCEGSNLSDSMPRQPVPACLHGILEWAGSHVEVRCASEHGSMWARARFVPLSLFFGSVHARRLRRAARHNDFR